MKADKTMLEILQRNCGTLAAVLTDQADREAIKDAERQIVETAMIIAGYTFDPDKGQYFRTE